jgi:PAS domain S-box-containing protein
MSEPMKSSSSELAPAEVDLAHLRRELEMELAATRNLHELESRLLLHQDLRSLLNEILRAAENITAADMGNIQLLDAMGILQIEVHRGFAADFLDFFQTVSDESSVCGMALAHRERVIVPDIEQDASLAGTPTLNALRKAGVRAVQSTPIIDRTGALVGMLSTHYRKPAQPNERDLRVLDLLARQAADLIYRLRAEEALRKSQEELQASQQQLALITDSMAAAVTRCSRDFKYVWVSRGCATWLGHSPEDMIGRPIRDILGPDAYEDICPYMERVLTGERVEYTAEVNYRGPGKKWIHAVYVPTYSDDAVDGWIAVISDLTEVMAYQRQLQTANENLARANKDLEYFAFAASHDLQEPLRMISIYSQLLARNHSDSTSGDPAMFLENIVEGAARMRALLGDLQTYTHLGASANGMAEAVDLNDVLSDVRRNLDGLVGNTAAEVTADPLPAVPIHPAHATSLLQNLIVNAITYRSDQPPRIHISATAADGEYRFAVADNDIGIDPEYHAQIFELFKRLHSGRIPGTGVGLAICKRVVEQYGGRIWVESAEGEGATFFFTIPVSAAQAAGGADQ